eukprot:m.146573 g.146573  ORF g.146573 m.146573 type:complete len:285 (+) comp16244_c0_seq7:54-908(+)
MDVSQPVAHVKVYHHEYRRFLLPYQPSLPNNDILYFDGSVWKDLRSRLELVFPDLRHTPYLIIPQDSMRALDRLSIRTLLLKCQRNQTCCHLRIKLLLPPPNPVARFAASLSQLADDELDKPTLTQPELDQPTLAPPAVSDPGDPSSIMQACPTAAQPATVVPSTTVKPASPRRRRRLSRVVNLVINRLQDLNQQLGAGLIDIANTVVPPRSQSRDGTNNSCHQPSEAAAQPDDSQEQLVRLQTVLQDMGFEVQIDMLKSLALVHTNDVNAMVSDVIELYSGSN